MDKLYGIIVGQCSQSALSVLQNDEEYEEKDDMCDMVWLLGKMKEITSGLGLKSNKRLNLHDALLNLTKVYQNRNEIDDDYMKRFKGNIDTLHAAVGANVLCIEEITETKSP